MSLCNSGLWRCGSMHMRFACKPTHEDYNHESYVFSRIEDNRCIELANSSIIVRISPRNTTEDDLFRFLPISYFVRFVVKTLQSSLVPQRRASRRCVPKP